MISDDLKRRGLYVRRVAVFIMIVYRFLRQMCTGLQNYFLLWKLHVYFRGGSIVTKSGSDDRSPRKLRVALKCYGYILCFFYIFQSFSGICVWVTILCS